MVHFLLCVFYHTKKGGSLEEDHCLRGPWMERSVSKQAGSWGTGPWGRATRLKAEMSQSFPWWAPLSLVSPWNSLSCHLPSSVPLPQGPSLTKRRLHTQPSQAARPRQVWPGPTGASREHSGSSQGPTTTYENTLWNNIRPQKGMKSWGVLQHGWTPKTLLLSERSQMQKTTYCMKL